MPEGPLGGPRPFANSNTGVLLDIKLSDPVSEEDFMDIPDDTPKLTEIMIEDLIAEAGVNRSRIYVGRKMSGVGMTFRSILTYRDVQLSVPEAAGITENVRNELDNFYRPILEDAGQVPAPFTATWKCSSIESLVSGEDLESRAQRSTDRAMERLRSDVRGPAGGPRPFANPDGLIIEYTISITGPVIDTARFKDQLLNIDTGGNLPTYDKKVKIVSANNQGETRVLIDKGFSGASGLDVIAINREVPLRVGKIERVRIRDSILRCGE